jgi:hypothetical protein
MAHVALHFSFGIAVVTALMLRGLIERWRKGDPMAAILGRWLLWSYTAGLYASIPSLLRQTGVPDAICNGGWMNVFLLYALIKRLFTFGGMPLGALALGLCFAVQYTVLLVAIMRTRRPQKTSHSNPEHAQTDPRSSVQLRDAP